MEININGKNVSEKIKSVTIVTVVLVLVVFSIWYADKKDSENSQGANSDEIQAGREAKEMLESMDDSGFSYDILEARELEGRVGDKINEAKYYVYGIATEEGGEPFGLRVKMYHYIEEDVWRIGDTSVYEIPEDY